MIGLIANIVMFIVWAIVMYKLIKAEKKVKKKNETIEYLKSDNRSLELLLEGAEANHLKIYKNPQYTTYEDLFDNEPGLNYKGANKTMGYVIEVNNGIYLVEEKTDTYKYWECHGTLIEYERFTFTNDAFKATNYSNLETARKYAKQCGGRVLQHKPNLEVVE